MNIKKASISNINIAIQELENEEVIAFPTETVYGLGGDATSSKAVQKIFKIKNRPFFNPLICHVENIKKVKEIAILHPIAEEVLKRFSPGPLTLILPQKKDNFICKEASSNLNTIAIRIPRSTCAQEILKKFKKPLCAPSANIFGGISPTSAEHVRKSLGNKVKLILDGGKCKIGLESTIIDFSNFEKNKSVKILRHGGLQQEKMEIFLAKKNVKIIENNNSDTSENNPIIAPGMLNSHYSPKKPLYINQEKKKKNGFFIGFGNVECDINLSVNSDLNEAAANLFAHLHYADSKNIKSISIAKIPYINIGKAINDRLNRAQFKTKEQEET